MRDSGWMRRVVALDQVDERKLVVAEPEEEVLFGDRLGGLAVGAEAPGGPSTNISSPTEYWPV